MNYFLLFCLLFLAVAANVAGPILKRDTKKTKSE